jgi:hypothetical protein
MKVRMINMVKIMCKDMKEGKSLIEKIKKVKVDLGRDE